MDQGAFFVSPAGAAYYPLEGGDMLVTLEDFRDSSHKKVAVIPMTHRLPDYILCDGRWYSAKGWDTSRDDRVRCSYYLQKEGFAPPEGSFHVKAREWYEKTQRGLLVAIFELWKEFINRS